MGHGYSPEHLLNDEALQKEARSLGKDPANFSMRDSNFNRSRSAAALSSSGSGNRINILRLIV